LRTQVGDIRVGGWTVEGLLARGRIEGVGPSSAANECGGRCCRHGVYVSLPERDRILAYADRIQSALDDSQTPDTSLWFENEIERDEDYPGGLCIGTAVYNGKCAFLNRDGLCTLQLIEPDLDLAEGERLKPFYCRLFPLVTSLDRVEFDDLCDGVCPCCTLAFDGPTPAIDAYAAEFKEILGEEGYEQLRRAIGEPAGGSDGGQRVAR
jgi:Fe-S-cluster containining protein